MSDKTPIPDLLLERLALGELSDEEARALRTRIDADESAQQRLLALERNNREVLAAYPAPAMARDIEGRWRAASARDPERRTRPWLVAVPALATAALVVVLVLPSEPPAQHQERAETVLLKGIEPRLRVFTQEDGRARALASGETLQKGALVQLAYVAAGQRHGVIVSLDGRGEVTVHLPADGGTAPALENGGLVRLPHAYQLDDAPRFERFFFVTALAPFSVETVTQAVRSLENGGRKGGLTLPAGLSQVSFLVEKAPRGADR